MADVARLKNDDSMFAACERLWQDITDRKMYITGGGNIGAQSVCGLYSEFCPAATADVTLTYMPYFTWANWGENEMQVWTLIRNCR